MIIVLDKNNMWLHFTLERKDFVGEVGHKFIAELVIELPDDAYITDKFLGNIIITLDMDYWKVFIKLYKKYFIKTYLTQIVKIYDEFRTAEKEGN